MATMQDFKKAAQAALSNSPLQAGREKMQWERVLDQPLTLIEFDLNDGPETDNDGKVVYKENGEISMVVYGTVVLAEYPNNYFGSFFDLKRVLDHFVDMFDGDIEKASEELKECGGLKLKVTRTISGKKIRNRVTLL